MLVRLAPILLATPWQTARPAQATLPHPKAPPPVPRTAQVSGTLLSALCPPGQQCTVSQMRGSCLEVVESQASHRPQLDKTATLLTTGTAVSAVLRSVPARLWLGRRRMHPV